MLADRLKPDLGTRNAFLLTFPPIVLLIFGVFSLRDSTSEEPSKFDRVAVYGGLIGVIVLTGMNAYGAWQLLGGIRSADSGLITLGLVVGTVTSIVYVKKALEFIRPPAR